MEVAAWRYHTVLQQSWSERNGSLHYMDGIQDIDPLLTLYSNPNAPTPDAPKFFFCMNNNDHQRAHEAGMIVLGECHP